MRDTALTNLDALSSLRSALVLEIHNNPELADAGGLAQLSRSTRARGSTTSSDAAPAAGAVCAVGTDPIDCARRPL